MFTVCLEEKEEEKEEKRGGAVMSAYG